MAKLIEIAKTLATTDRVVGATFLLATAAAIVALGGAMAAWRRRRLPRRYCPGPGPGLVARLHPWHWLISNRCGYDLSAHLGWQSAPPQRPRAGCGPVTCPECGRTTPAPRRLRRTPWQVRIAPSLAGLLIACGVLIAGHPYPRRWLIHRTPTPALVLCERILGKRSPYIATHELVRRYGRGDLADDLEPLMIDVLIRQLRHDEHHFNAIDACHQLERRAGPAAEPVLKRALASDDWQQRQFAAYLLRRLDAPPSVTLLNTVAEGLRSGDGLPRDIFVGITFELDYLRYGLRYLVEHIDVAEPWLRRGLWSDDYQQRVLCAGGLGLAGRGELADVAAPLLADRLRDNDTRRDALFALRALAGFGDAALPSVLPLLDAADDQQREAARQLAGRFWPPTVGLPPIDYQPARDDRITYHVRNPLPIPTDELPIPFLLDDGPPSTALVTALP